MTLPKEQRTEIRFDQGLDEGTYDEAQANQVFITNGEIRREGGVQKRAGFSVSLNVGSLSSSESGACEAHPTSLLTTRNGGVIIQRKLDSIKWTGAHAQRRTDNTTLRDNWHGNVRAIASAVSSGSATFRTYTDVDGAVLTLSGRDYALLVESTADSADNPPRFQAIDVATGLVVHQGFLETGAAYPRAAAHGGKFYIYYILTSSGDIRRTSFDPSVALPVNSTATVVAATADIAQPGGFDVFAGNGAVRLAWMEAGGSLEVRAVTPGTDTVTLSATTALGAGTHRIGVVTDGSITHVVNGRDATTFRVLRYDATLTLTHTSTPAGQSNLTHLRVGIAMYPNSSGASAPVFAVTYAAVTGGAPLAETLSWARLTNDHGTVGGAVQEADLTLLSKPWIEYSTSGPASQDPPEPVYAATLSRRNNNGIAHVFVGRFSPENPTGILTSFYTPYCAPIASLLHNGGNMMLPVIATHRSCSLPSVGVIEDTTDFSYVTHDWYIPQLRLLESLGAVAEGNLLVQPDEVDIYGAVMLRLEHGAGDPLPRSVANGNGWQGGALLRVHDGYDFGEAAQLFPAQTPVLADSGAGTLDAGTYSYVHVLVYEAADGLVYRSAPSPAANITVIANHDITVTVYARPPTMRAGRPNISTIGGWRSEVYRTQKAGTGVYQLLNARQLGTFVDTSYVLTDALEDADLDGNKFLYTEGNVLPAEAPGPACALVTHGDRVFGVDAVDRRVLFYSKPFEEGIAPEFNGLLRSRLEGLDGDMVALESMDDKLIVFTATSVYTVSGDGPDATGAGSFRPPELIADASGLAAPYAHVVIPAGLMYMSTGGMALLGRGLDVTDISEPVTIVLNNADVNGNLPVRALHVPNLKQVWWFYGGSARDQSEHAKYIIVFDYSRGRGRWMYHEYQENVRILDAVMSAGQPHLLLLLEDRAFLARRDPTVNTDGGTSTPAFVPLRVDVLKWRAGYRTPDGRFSEVGLLDECRIRRVHIVGASSLNDVSTLRLEVTRARQPRSFDTTFTETYNFSAVDMEDAGYLHVETRLRYQRITSVDFGILSVSGGTADDDGPVLNALVVDWAPTGRTARRGAGFDPT